jgi:hypothetical protein
MRVSCTLAAALMAATPALAQPFRFAMLAAPPGTVSVQPAFRPSTLSGPLGFSPLPGTRGFEAFAGPLSMLGTSTGYATSMPARSSSNPYMMSMYSNPYMAGYGMNMGGQYANNSYDLSAISRYLMERPAETSPLAAGARSPGGTRPREMAAWPARPAARGQNETAARSARRAASAGRWPKGKRADERHTHPRGPQGRSQAAEYLASARRDDG